MNVERNLIQQRLGFDLVLAARLRAFRDKEIFLGAVKVGFTSARRLGSDCKSMPDGNTHPEFRAMFCDKLAC